MFRAATKQLLVRVTLLIQIGLASNVYAESFVDESGFSGVQVGMSASEARTKMSEDLPDIEGPNDDCYFIGPGAKGKVFFMLEKKKISRVDVIESGIRTQALIEVGDTEEKALKAYPNAVVSIHKYDDFGHYITIDSKDRKSAIIFETDGKIISRIRAGQYPSVGYVEGCS